MSRKRFLKAFGLLCAGTVIYVWFNYTRIFSPSLVKSPLIYNLEFFANVYTDSIVTDTSSGRTGGTASFVHINNINYTSETKATIPAEQVSISGDKKRTTNNDRRSLESKTTWNGNASLEKKSDMTTMDPLARPDNCSSCFSHNFKYIHMNNHICNTTQTGTEVDIIILIATVHSHRNKRQAIRETWLDLSKNNTSNVRYVFMLGSQTNENISKDTESEYLKYHDIVQEDFIDRYSNLTLKTMMGFKWASTYCPNAKFVMKTDDDMYVNVPNLLKTVFKYKLQLQTSVGGYCKLKDYPIRDPLSKWYASFRNYPRAEYPGYCSGTGYVTSISVVSKVFEVSKDVPFFYLEDVYVALCIKRLKYKLTPIPGFNPVLVQLNSCVYKGDTMITSHGLSAENILQVHRTACVSTTKYVKISTADMK